MTPSDPIRSTADAATRTLARTFVVLGVLVAASLLMAGCHDEERLRQRMQAPPARLPVEPDQPESLPAPALLDTVTTWEQPPGYDDDVTDDWQLVEVQLGGGHTLTYRVPETWMLRARAGTSRSRNGDVGADARLTDLTDSEMSLASYAAQLADGNPIWQYSTADGHVVYLTRREVALAPSDPDAPREIFHTAVISIDGDIAKLDVRYDLRSDFRYDELAAAITGTMQVRRSSAAR